MPRLTAVLAVVVLVARAPAARAQGLPEEPISLGGGRVIIGADVTATTAEADPGYFNFTDYAYSALRNVRVGVSAKVRASDRLQILGELRMDQGGLFQPLALYARVRPWPARRFDIQAGRIPPTFGAFSRAAYSTANPLIGTPLAYQYLTSLRPDAIPATADELLRMRGRGWLSYYSVGGAAAERGLPIVNTVRWDTGVQVHGVNGIVEWTGAVTTGTLANPRVDDDNDGRQLAGRVVVRPSAALALGASVARGSFLNRALEGTLPPGRLVEDGVQRAVAIDTDYARGRFVGRAEAMWSRFTLPVRLVARSNTDLDAWSIIAEGRYRVMPGMYVAGRVERLGFGELDTAAGPEPWEAPVRRVELGAGYSLLRNLTIKASWQHNRRDIGRLRRDSLGAMQVAYWF
jgi:hypothetical protein